MVKEGLQESDFERIDGVIRTLSVAGISNTVTGRDEGGIFFSVTGEPMKNSPLTIARIVLDRAKLANFGIVHILIEVKDGDHTRIWREIVNPVNVSIEHDVSGLMERLKHTKKSERTVL